MKGPCLLQPCISIRAFFLSNSCWVLTVSISSISNEPKAPNPSFSLIIFFGVFSINRGRAVLTWFSVVNLGIFLFTCPTGVFNAKSTCVGSADIDEFIVVFVSATTAQLIFRLVNFEMLVPGPCYPCFFIHSFRPFYLIFCFQVIQ